MEMTFLGGEESEVIVTAQSRSVHSRGRGVGVLDQLIVFIALIKRWLLNPFCLHVSVAVNLYFF